MVADANDKSRSVTLVASPLGKYMPFLLTRGVCLATDRLPQVAATTIRELAAHSRHPAKPKQVNDGQFAGALS